LDVLLLVIAAALVPIAGLLAAADAAITMVSPARLEELAREDRRGASSLLTITEDRPRYTNLLLLLRITAEITATVMVAKVALTTLGFQFWVGLLLVAVMVVVTYVGIGVLPRTIGRQHPYPVGLALAGPTRALARLLAPVASLLILIGNAITPGRGFREGPFSSDIELRELVDIAGSRGVVEETEREMLQSVFDLGDTIVREVMVPRTETVWIERDKTLRQALALASRSGMSRIPVVGEDLDDIVGVAYLKDLIAPAMNLAPDDQGPVLTQIMREPVFVPESKNVDDLLREMQRDRTHFAVVVDEYGGTAGIVTIEDILEEIVGEITDEYDADTPAPVVPLPDGSFRVSARLPVEDLGELFDVELDDDEVDTVGGLLAQQLGRVPLPGSEVGVAGLFLHGEPGVDRRGRPRVQTVLVRRLTAAELAQEQAERDREVREREDQRRAQEQEPERPAVDESDAEPAEAKRAKPRKKKKKAKPPAADESAEPGATDSPGDSPPDSPADSPPGRSTPADPPLLGPLIETRNQPVHDSTERNRAG
jgi:CBS domain containing-hemolysin-like protein